MKDEKEDEISQIIITLLKTIKPNEKPPIILSSQDLDMIIDSSYYSLKLNLDLKNILSQNNNSIYSSPHSLSGISQKNFSEKKLLNPDGINITDAEVNNYIKQAEKYISAINKKTLDSLEKEEKLNINELLTQMPSISIQTNINDINNNNSYSNKILPFDYISNYELDNYTNNSNILKNGKYFILSEYRQSKVIRYNPMNSTVNEKIYKQIQKYSFQITCITTKNNVLYFGNNLGSIKSIGKGHEYKTYESDELKNLNDMNKSVTCLCFSPDNITFVSGHENGVIILWDTYEAKVKKFISPSKKDKSRIIAVKYLIKENGNYTIIASNVEGKIKLVIIIEGYVMTSVCIQNIINKPYPCYLVETLNFDNEEKRLYNLKMDNNTNYLTLIGNEELIELYLLSEDSSILSSYTTGNKEFKMQNILSIRNPKNIFMSQSEQYLNYPSASFGYGYIYQEKEAKNKIKNIISEEESEKEQDNSNNIKGNILLSVAWHNIISIYIIPIKNNQIQKPIYQGYYKDNSSNIIHIGFFSSSIIYYLDENRKIKLLNTNNIIKGEDFDNNNNNNYNYSNNQSKEISSSEEILNMKEIDRNNYKEIVIKDFNLMYNLNPLQNIKIYKNFICSTPKNIYILSRNSFNHILLYGWKECLDNMKSNFDWLTLFSVGIDIYKGCSNIKTLDDIPNDTSIRKYKLKYELKKYVKEYFTINLNDNINMNSNFDFVNITIETCINIEEIDFLLHDIYDIINIKGFGNLFLDRFEPFILKDKLITHNLASSTLQTLIELYINNNKIYNLSQALLHLNVKCLKYQLIKDIALQYDFFSTIIYIYTNTKNNYFYPLIVMYEKFSSLIKDNNNIDEKFMEIINDTNNKIENKYEKLEKTKEYLGYKIFWFINICLKGRKFPKFNELIDEKTYYDIIIVFFIFYSNALNLRLFDSYTYFLILEHFFTDKNILYIIKNINEKIVNDIQKRANIQLFNNKENMNINLESIITNGIYKTQIQNNYFFDKFDLSFFIIKISSKIQLKENILYDSLFFLLNYYKAIANDYNSLKSNDTFGIHDKILNFDSEFLKDFNKHVISSVETLKNYYTDYSLFKSRYLNNLINIVKESPFILIKIYIFDLNNDYNKCIDLYLENNSLSYEDKLTVFNYINKKFEELKINPYLYGDGTNNNEINYFKEFKNYISNKIEKLATISIEELEKLILTWFNKEQISIINKLNIVPEIQLQYLHFFTKEIINNYNENEKISEEMKDIFLLYFELLIKMDKSSYLISALKEGVMFYPLDNCLKLTLNYNLNETSIYIYEILGKYNEALSIAINEIDKVYLKTKNIIVNKDDFELDIDNKANMKDIKEDLFYKLQRSINIGIKICQKVSGNDLKSSFGNIYLQLWYNLFHKLFGIYEDIKSSDINNSMEKISLLLLLTKEIENFLKNAFVYQGTAKIIYYITTINQNRELYSDFIGFIQKILPLLNNYTSLLKSGELLFNQFYKNDINIFGKKTFQGVDLNIIKCHMCHKNIDKSTKKKIVAFQCGHLMHLGCCFIYEERPYCSLCYDSIYEYQITFPKNIKSEKIEDEPNKEQLEAQKNRKKLHLFTKLDILDDEYYKESI